MTTKPLPLLLAFILSILTSSADALTTSDQKCQDVIERWLWNQSDPRMNVADASLTVDWRALDARLSQAGCAYDHFWLELYRGGSAIGDKPWSEQVQLYDACNSLDNLVTFELHDSLQHFQGEQGPSWFPHVVERQYVLRLCPCGKREVVEAGQRLATRCDCEYTEGRVFCSDQISFAQNARVPNYCLDDKSAGPSASSASLQTPAVQCNGTSLSGTLASCTPVQDYDRVLLRLHKVADDVVKCAPEHHASATSIDLEAKLRPLNLTDGVFQLETFLLEPASTYCLGLDLRKHPYCQGNIVAGGESRQRSHICSTLISKPLRTSDKCGGQPPIILDDGSSNLVATLVVSALLLVFFVFGIACFMWRRLRRKNRTPQNIIPHDVVQNKVQREMSPPDPPGDIFLLYFPESEEFGEVNARLREWLAALGSTVYDLSDDVHGEAIVTEQERWAEARLADPATRVLLVNSPLSAAASSSEGGSSSSEATPLMGDSVHDLRRNALRSVQAQLVGRYDRLCVVTYGEVGPARSALKSLTPSTDWTLPANLEQVGEWVVRSRGRWGSRSCAGGEAERAFRMALAQLKGVKRLSSAAVGV